MFHILANTHQFPRQPKLLLDRFIGLDLRCWVIGAVEVPCVEAGEVLNRSEELIAADYVAAVSFSVSTRDMREKSLLVVATNFR
jgi:hypothetical protein